MKGRVEVLDLFSAAAGGWSLGMHRAGYVTVAACEVEAWRRAIYSENNPYAKVYDDVRTLTADRLRADLGRLPTFVVGSPPCQDISSANTKGRGVEGARSGLYFEAVRIIGECRPRWFALENSANLRTRGYDAVHAALEAIGYTCWPCVVRAGDIGANHDRARAWVLGCDLAQVTDTDGIGRDEGRRWGWNGVDVPVPADTRGATQNGCGPGLPGRRALATERLSVEARGDAADAHSDALRLAVVPGEPKPEAALAGDAYPATDADEAERRSGELAGSSCERAASGWQQGASESRSIHSAGCEARDAAHADQARQAHGRMEPGVRQAEIADDGRGAGRRDDGPGTGQVGLCPADSLAAIRGGADWSLADLADHLRLDDGLSARLASTRVAVGGPTGTTAASLVVEAFGDAVIPQIPEAIGRAIQRVERALAAVHDRIAA